MPHVEMDTDPAGVKRKRIDLTSGTNGRRYRKKMAQDANLPHGQEPNWDAADAAAIGALHICEEAFFQSIEETPEKVFEIAFPVMENERVVRKYLKTPEAFVATSLRIARKRE